MLRLAAAVSAVLFLASAAHAEPVWRSYAPVVPVAGFAYSGPGNAVWRLWRERTVVSAVVVTADEDVPALAAETPDRVAAAPPPSATVAEKVSAAEPTPVPAAEAGPVEPVAVAAQVAEAKPVAPTAVVEPPPSAVAEPPSGPAWSPGAQVSLAALVIAAFAVIVFLIGRRGERAAS